MTQRKPAIHTADQWVSSWVGVCLMTRKFANSSGVDIKIQGSVVRKANKAIHSLSSERYPLDSAYPASRVASIFPRYVGLPDLSRKIDGDSVRSLDSAIRRLNNRQDFFRGSTSTHFRHSLAVSLSVLEVS